MTQPKSKAEKKAAALAALRPVRFCDRLEREDKDTGQISREMCLLWPKPADCIECKDPWLRFNAVIERYKEHHPNGKYRPVERRHAIVIEFTDAGRTWTSGPFNLTVDHFTEYQRKTLPQIFPKDGEVVRQFSKGTWWQDRQERLKKELQ